MYFYNFRGRYYVFIKHFIVDIMHCANFSLSFLNIFPLFQAILTEACDTKKVPTNAVFHVTEKVHNIGRSNCHTTWKNLFTLRTLHTIIIEIAPQSIYFHVVPAAKNRSSRSNIHGKRSSASPVSATLAVILHALLVSMTKFCTNGVFFAQRIHCNLLMHGIIQNDCWDRPRLFPPRSGDAQGGCGQMGCGQGNRKPTTRWICHGLRLIGRASWMATLRWLSISASGCSTGSLSTISQVRKTLVRCTGLSESNTP